MGRRQLPAGESRVCCRLVSAHAGHREFTFTRRVVSCLPRAGPRPTRTVDESHHRLWPCDRVASDDDRGPQLATAITPGVHKALELGVAHLEPAHQEIAEAHCVASAYQPAARDA